MTAGLTKGFLCCFRLTTSHKKRESQLSRHKLALSANPTVHRTDLGGLYRRCSAVPQLVHCGSKPNVKGRPAVRSTGRCKAHLHTYIIENPPTDNAHALFPLPFFRFFLSQPAMRTTAVKTDPHITSAVTNPAIHCVASTFVPLDKISPP